MHTKETHGLGNSLTVTDEDGDTVSFHLYEPPVEGADGYEMVVVASGSGSRGIVGLEPDDVTALIRMIAERREK